MPKPQWPESIHSLSGIPGTIQIASIVDTWARKHRRAGTSSRRPEGRLKDVLAANLTAPYDATTEGGTQQSKDRFITAVYDEGKDFPPVVDGKRAMPRRP